MTPLFQNTHIQKKMKSYPHSQQNNKIELSFQSGDDSEQAECELKGVNIKGLIYSPVVEAPVDDCLAESDNIRQLEQDNQSVGGYPGPKGSEYASEQ